MKISVFNQSTMDLKVKSFYVDLIVKKEKGNELIKFYVNRVLSAQIEFNQINDFVETYHFGNEDMINELNTYSATVKAFIEILPEAFLGINAEFNAKLIAVKKALKLDNYSYECFFNEALRVNGIEGN